MPGAITRLALYYARALARRSRWPAAASAYRSYLRRCPDDAAAWIQLGHMLREQRDALGSGDAYRRATEIAPADPDAWFQLGHAHALAGDRPFAVKAFSAALRADPGYAKAIDALVAAGARDLLPIEVQARAERGEIGDEEVYAVCRYSAYRANLVIPPPPASRCKLLPVVDARNGDAAALKATLDSLAAQSVEAGPVIIVVGKDRQDAGGQAFVQPHERVTCFEDGALLLHMQAGTVLDRHAAAWMGSAADRDDPPAAIYSDHEDAALDGGWSPMLQPMFDPYWFSTPAVRPSLVASRPNLASGSTWADVLHDARDVSLAARSGPVVHVPLLLARRSAENLVVDTETTTENSRSTESDIASPSAIDVVIQTRDQADVLRRCVESLRATARLPERLRLLIVDNRSQETRTKALLDIWEAGRIVSTMRLDEPFNWSRANNLAAARGSAPLLLFLNNDTQSLTPGWDNALRKALSNASVGIVGATLRYADGSLQHAGITFGLNDGGPVHAGLGDAPHHERTTPWSRSRLTSATTGAWMGIRREVFAALGGFDERFPVSFNDVDICLRARREGYWILQSAAIEALHHESLTRGLHLDAAAQAREQRDAERLRGKWARALLQDPSYNPRWTRIGRPYDGYRVPALSEILEWIERSAARDPWQVGTDT